MPTRYNVTSSPAFGVAGLPSGFGGKSEPSLSVPSVGLEDVDVALFTLFNKEIPFEVSSQGGDDLKRVPVIFASGEKWAVLKNGRALRDRNNTLILPLITIGRSMIKQASAEDITGRGMNQQTGELVIKRRLDVLDRGYQGLINRLLLPNQPNLAVDPVTASDGQLATSREIGNLSGDPSVVDGSLLVPAHDDNVFETLTLPSPQFYTAVYEVTFWTQYTQHMNQLLEQLVSSFLPQGQSWRLDTPKGYWFVATVDENTYTADSNFDDMAAQERVIKYKFTVSVPAYVLATATPGAPVPIKRFVSSPIITFVTAVDPRITSGPGGLDDPFLGADDPTLPLANGKTRRRDQRETGATRLFPNPDVVPDSDPALVDRPRSQDLARYRKVMGFDRKGNKVTRFVRIKSTNAATGETVFASDVGLGGLTVIIED